VSYSIFKLRSEALSRKEERKNAREKYVCEETKCYRKERREFSPASPSKK
jgi:hypothetical protein